jgi:hypothetical protein
MREVGGLVGRKVVGRLEGSKRFTKTIGVKGGAKKNMTKIICHEKKKM